jgi:hypothetical protein
MLDFPACRTRRGPDIFLQHYRFSEAQERVSLHALSIRVHFTGRFSFLCKHRLQWIDTTLQ